MKNCTGCKWAEWHKTAAGRLHPSGDGKCAYPYALPPLPAAMGWIGKEAPRPLGGHINRRRDNKEHCTYYQKEALKMPKKNYQVGKGKFFLYKK